MKTHPQRRRCQAARRTGVLALLAATSLGATACVKQGRTVHPDEAKVNAGLYESGCPVEPMPDVKGSVRLGFQALVNGDLIVRDRGWMEECLPGVDVTWLQFPSGAEVVNAFGSDQVDVASIGSAPASRVMSPPLADSVDVQVVWIFDVIGKAESLIAKDPAIKDVKGLEGKSIGVPFSSTAHFSLQTAIEDAGIQGKVDLVNLTPERMLPGYQRGDIDAAFVWDPVQSSLLDDGGHRVTSAEETAKIGTPTYDLGVAQRGFIEKNPEVMQMWTQLQDRAVQEIKDDPDKAASSIGAQLTQDPESVKKQFEGFIYLTGEEQKGKDYFGSDQLGQDIYATAEFLKEQGEVRSTSPEKVYVDGVYRDAITKDGS